MLLGLDGPLPPSPPYAREYKQSLAMSLNLKCLIELLSCAVTVQP